MHVDFSFIDRESYVVQPWPDEEVRLYPTRRRQRDEGKSGTVLKDDLVKKKSFTMKEMAEKCASDGHRQECMNSLIYALSKAAGFATASGEVGPPDRSEIDEETLMMTSAGLAALENDQPIVRSFDSGATFGMDIKGKSPENEFKDRAVRIHTGDGIVKSDTWSHVETPWGWTKNICLPKTARTHSAGDCNAQFGVGMSWLSPDECPNESPGPCILHTPVPQEFGSTEYSHVVWHGSHDIVCPEINANTPALRDGTRKIKLTGDFCATAGCQCGLRKLSHVATEAWEKGIGMPAQEEKEMHVAADVRPSASASGSRAPPPPEAAPEVVQEPQAGRPADEAELPERPCAKIFGRSDLALHGADGKPCRCEVCLRVKQRRHRASADSHPHAEAKIRRLEGAHDFGSVATYFDTIDYGPAASFCQGARYDLLGYDVTSACFLVMPMRDKTTETQEKSLRILLGARETLVCARCDSANDLTGALENVAKTCLPTTPYSPNENLVERMSQTFGDLSAIHFAQSGFSPFWRPILSIATAQAWNFCRSTVRLDVDGNEEARPPAQWRHTLNYNPVRDDILLPGMAINVVMPKLKQSATDKILPRGTEFVFLCYYERHGVCDGSVLALPLESLLTGAGSFALQRTRDYRVVGEPCFPLRKARDWNLMLRSAKLWKQADQKQLDEEIQALLNDKPYVPKVVFETPRSLKEESGSSTTGAWQPEVDEHTGLETVSASITASEPGPVPPERNISVQNRADSDLPSTDRAKPDTPIPVSLILLLRSKPKSSKRRVTLKRPIRTEVVTVCQAGLCERGMIRRGLHMLSRKFGTHTTISRKLT